MIYWTKWITESISRYDYNFIVAVMLTEFTHFDLLEAIKPLALLNQIPFSCSLFPSHSLYLILHRALFCSLMIGWRILYRMMPSIQIAHKMYSINSIQKQRRQRLMILFCFFFLFSTETLEPDQQCRTIQKHNHI